MRRPLRIVLWSLAIVLLAAAAGLAIRWGVQSLDRPLNVEAPLRFKVPIGARFARVAADLGKQGVVAQPRTWVLYARWTGLATGIKAGEYEIEPGMTPRRLLEKMVSGQVLLHSLTIVDGWRVQDLLTAMRRNPDILSTLPSDGAAHLMDSWRRRVWMRKASSCRRLTAFRAVPAMWNCCARHMPRSGACSTPPGRIGILRYRCKTPTNC